MDLQQSAATLVPVVLIGTYVNLLVTNITSGVFSGMGRPLIATILSFGLELPLSIGGVALYIFIMRGNLLGVYWWQAISGGVEVVIVFFILITSNFDYWAFEARKRQEVGILNESDDGSDDDEEEDYLSHFSAPEESTYSNDSEKEADAENSARTRFADV